MVNQLPQGWKEEELGKLAEVSCGDSAPQSSSYFLNGSYPFCRTSDVGKIHRSSNFSEIEDHINETAISKLHLFRKGTILFPKSGASTLLNHRVMLSIDSYVSSHLATIYANGIDRYYLYYFLCIVDAKQLVPNLDYPSLKISELKNIKIPYPTDRDEQNYIVKTLDAVAEMIKLRKETIQLTKDLIPAIFQEMFGDPITNPKGWKITTLGNPDICTLQYGYTATAQENGNIRYIRITDIGKDGYIDDSNIVWLNYENKMDDYKLRPKDILVARTGASYGKTLLYRNDADAIFASFLIRIIFNKKKIIPEFYWAYSLTASYWQQANRLVSGVAQPQFNGSALKQILLMLPPLSLQDEFAKKVERINKYIAVQQEELKHFETLFQSLLQEAFTGVLTWKYPRKESND